MPGICDRLSQLGTLLCRLRCKVLCCICISKQSYRHEMARSHSAGRGEIISVLSDIRRASVSSVPGSMHNISIAEIIELQTGILDEKIDP